jgi:hypothetical protein
MLRRVEFVRLSMLCIIQCYRVIFLRRSSRFYIAVELLSSAGKIPLQRTHRNEPHADGSRLHEADQGRDRMRKSGLT